MNVKLIAFDKEFILMGADALAPFLFKGISK